VCVCVFVYVCVCVCVCVPMGLCMLPGAPVSNWPELAARVMVDIHSNKASSVPKPVCVCVFVCVCVCAGVLFV